jgi:hypothetical protein
MYKDEAVQLMCETVNDFNRYTAKMQGMPEAQIEEFIVQSKEQMEYVNGLIYDALLEHGVIRN